MSEKPKRIVLSRRRGWRMPPNTVKVDRSTKWGNPFIVGKHGDRAYCAKLYGYLMGGYVCVSVGNSSGQMEVHEYVAKNHRKLRGKNLACWCPLNAECHADVLLAIANPADPHKEPQPRGAP